MRLPAVLIAVGLVCCPALPGIAQEGTPSAAIQPEGGAEVLGTVVRGNTTIIFQVKIQWTGLIGRRRAHGTQAFR